MTGHSDKSEISTADGTLPWYSETEIKSEQLYLSERLILLIGIGQTRAFACEFKFKLLHINDRQHSGSLSNVLSRLAVEVRVDGDELELELELACDRVKGVSTMREWRSRTASRWRGERGAGP